MRITMLLIALVLCRICCAQFVKEAQVETYPLQIGWDKTTVLVFPYEVVSADFGSAAVLSQKDKAAPNVLKLKAGQKGFKSTNMYVVTAEGKLYPFSVNYTDFPDDKPIDIGRQNEVRYAAALMKGTGINPANVAGVLDELMLNLPEEISWGKEQGMIRLGLGELVEKDGVLFFQLALENRSWIDYLQENWVFTIQDKKQGKRTAIRVLSLEPVCFRSFTGVSGRASELAVFAFPRFTISDAKEFTIQVFEKNGDRNPVLSIPGKKLLQTKPLLISNH